VAKKIADQIRGKVKQGTFWYIPENIEFTLRDGVFRWLQLGTDQNTTVRASAK
jgi:hypothetical protein